VGKETGSAVSAGTVNGGGSFVMRAGRVGADTMLAQIVEMVSAAQRSRAPIQRVADAVSQWFVPAVAVCALVTLVIWLLAGPEPALSYALANAVAVLIIACPCALGLATPMSIMVGVGRGAGLGVLIRDAAALERLGVVDTVVVDKTGTLTEGRPALVALEAEPGFDRGEVLALAAALENPSEHPLARAIVAAAREKGLAIGEPENFEAFAGDGVAGTVQGKRVMVGRPDWLVQRGVARVVTPEAKGTRIGVAIDGHFAGGMALADTLKPTTPAAIAALHALGLEVVMLTGDNSEVAEDIGRQAGIDRILAEVSPAGKQRHVEELRSRGAVVAMAGDGVNDAPALAAADVGIAMGAGTDVAMQTAGVTLVKGDLRGIVQAIALSRLTMRNIRQNLVFAFAYNVLGIPLAAGVLYPFFGVLLNPMVASAAMALSSVSVIGNALRLAKARLPQERGGVMPARGA
jgi:Cu+-exporting ATPase